MTIEERPGSGYAVEPIRLGGGGRGPWGPLAGAVVVAVVALAILKPWGSAEEAVRASASPSAAAPSAPAASAAGLPGPTLAAPSTLPSPDAQEVSTGLRPSDPIAVGLLDKVGSWGLASGGWWPTGGEPWLLWTGTTGLREGSILADPPDCSGLMRLPAGQFVAVTAPSGLAATGRIQVLAWDEQGTRVPEPEVRRIARTPDLGTSFVLRTGGARWDDGSYRLAIWTPVGPVTMDLCLGGPSPTAALSAASVPSGLLDAVDPGYADRFEPLARASRPHAGVWGVGSGGYRSGGDPWSTWKEVRPVPGGSSSGIRGAVARECALAMPTVAAGALVTVTTRIPIADPGDVTPLRYELDGSVTQVEAVAPLPKRDDTGIVELYRLDGRAWHPGAYRFAIATAGGPVALDVCLAGWW